MTTARSSPPDEPKPPLARLVELALVVPIEVSSRLVEVVPAVVDKIPPAAERVKREIVLARFLGKLAVDQGVRELRSRLAPPEPVSATDPPGQVEAASDARAPLADYDHLSSAQIVGMLGGLDAVERQAIERYERAGRHRRTILGKLEQLGADE